MGAKAVQVSMDADLLRIIDDDPETKAEGRSTFLRNAATAYLRAKRNRAIEAQFRRAYGTPEARDQHLREVEDFLDVQAWPEP